MGTPLKLLMAEDNPADAELVLITLRQAGYKSDWRRVETEADFLGALQDDPDLVISDYSMPRFSALRALELIKARRPGIPFIIVSGTIGEETAVEAMRLGATDYLLKDRLGRLGPAVAQAIDQARLRRERRQNEEALRNSEERLRLVTANARVGLVMVNRERCYTFANAAYAEILDLPSPDIVGQRVADVLAPLYEQQIRPRLDRAFAGERIVYELSRPAPDGLHHYAVRYEPTKGGGEVSLVVVVITDITERKRAEESVQASEARYRTLFEYAPDGIVIADAESRYLDVNASACRMFGYSRKEFIGLHASDIVVAAEVPHIAPALAGIKATADYHREWQFRRKDGSTFSAEVMATKMPDGNLLGMIRDITARRLAEAALQQREADFRVLFASNPMAMWVYELDTLRFLAVNDAAVLHYGYTREEFLAMTIKDIRPAEDLPMLLRSMERRPQGVDVSGVWRHRQKTGKIIFVHITSHPISFQDRPAELVLAQDVTAQHESERALKASEEHFRRLIENASDMITVIDEAGVVRFQGPSTQRLLGYAAGEMVDRPAGEFIHPDDHGKIGESVRRALAGERKPIPVEFRIRHHDGSWRIFQSFGQRMAEVAGKAQIVVNSRDITEQKKLEEQFLHAQRMEAIGTLASGVAHDLNNILAPMLMVAGILKLRRNASPKDIELLSIIESSAQRGAGIIRQLLSFSGSFSGERVTLQPKHLIHEMTKIMRETFPRNIAIVESVPSGLWTVEADATQLHQVILNLCVNARDAMPAGGTLTVEAGNVTVGEGAGTAAIDPAAKPGPYVLLQVKDTGTGIPPEIINRIFDPFFTTKGAAKGTGLGLSTVIGIIKGHGGYVRVYSEPGHGSAFHVYLPATTEGTGSSRRSDTVPPLARGHKEQILVVDDEEFIREATRSFLDKQGYQVLLAATGEEAVKVFLEHQGTVRLVLTDIMMPGMDGLALIRALRVLAPTLPIIATSGLDQNQNAAEFSALGVRKVLAKPVTPTQLLQAVASSLAPPVPPAG
jgi:two-component system cell cycle sensor histidine kinase/response regulator CckA